VEKWIIETKSHFVDYSKVSIKVYLSIKKLSGPIQNFFGPITGTGVDFIKIIYALRLNFALCAHLFAQI
jgi:hypothetical protein